MLPVPESEAKKRWAKENTVVITIKLNRNTDGDIIGKLESEQNRQGYLKALIRRDMHGDESGAVKEKAVAESWH